MNPAPVLPIPQRSAAPGEPAVSQPGLPADRQARNRSGRRSGCGALSTVPYLDEYRLYRPEPDADAE